MKQASTPTKPQMTRKELTSLVWRHAPSKFSGSQLVVLLKLAGMHKERDGGFYAFPGTTDLAKCCGLSRRGVQKTLQALTKDGILKVLDRPGHSNLFAIRADKLRAIPLVRPDDPSDDAVALATAIYRAITAEIPEAKPPDDWEDTWPVAMQTLISRGLTKESIATVARHAINNEPFTAEMTAHGALGLLRCFDAAKSNMEGGKQ